MVPDYQTIETAPEADSDRGGHSEDELEPFVLDQADFRNKLSPILEASRRAKQVPGLQSVWKSLLEVVER